MLSKNLYFIHDFDAKMHYSIYYSLFPFKEGININDSVQNRKCSRGVGRWNFIVAEEDYTCGVYHALEMIRQSIFSAMKNNKNSVDIALVPTKSDSDVCYVVNCEKYLENHIDMEKLKKIKVLPEDQRNHCECDTKISKSVLLNVVKPVLEVMFKKADFQITTKVIKDKVVSERFDQYPIKFKRDLNVINIEWCVDKFFKERIRDQKGSELELQLTG